jgi:sarcosine oxidase
VPTRYDIIIAGLGAVGSSTAYHAAKRGRRVLGLDRFTPPHAFGSSHGKSRIIREACFEHPAYVPLARRSYECWAELESRSRQTIVHRTGGVSVGGPDSVVVTGARASAMEFGLPYEEMSSADLARRIPAFHPDPGTVGIWDPRAGVVVPEIAIECQLAAAQGCGAELHFDETVTGWDASDAGGVRVTTPQGTYHADQLVLAVGAWLLPLLGALDLPLVVERQVMLWFRPAREPDRFKPGQMPIFIWEFAPGRAWYGLPDLGHGMKIGIHHEGPATTADSVQRDVTADDEAPIRALLERYIPDANGAPVASAVCLYTNTPDRHFLIDWHPEHRNVLIASPCSGHGFKYASALGEALTELLGTGSTTCDLSPFKLARLSVSS